MDAAHDSQDKVSPQGDPALMGRASLASLKAFTTYYKVVFFAAIIVLVLGTFVRSSLSGDGCGTSWPLCGGTLLPQDAPLKRLIEFSHRSSSELFGLLTLAGYFWARRKFPPGSLLRKSTLLAFVCTVVSGIFGASLVLNKWVVFDKSLARLVVMPAHLMNNFLLVAAIIFTVFWASGGHRITWKNQGSVGTGLVAALVAMFLMGVTGAVSAMGKTAYAAELSSANGMAERLALHLGPNAPAILKGGVLHPLMTTSVGLLLVWICGLVANERPIPAVRKWAKVVVALFVVQMAFGVANLVLSAPVWMQLTHLLIAVLDWAALVAMAAHALDVKWAGNPEAEEGPLEPSTLRAKVMAYVALTKPRVISLLLFTTLAAMFIAKGGAPGLGLTVLVMVGGYLAAGAANTFNQVVETDLDLAMERTSKRPIVSHILSKRQALTFAYAATAASFGILAWGANVLAAVMAMAGLLCYVFVYTLWLKRRTWQNIVIGGAAGAFPPLVGFAAVRGELNPLAWFLFALIFTWTPVHFWALALLIKDDYAKAGVPMLPVVKGDRVTVVQIVLYAVITALLPAVPLLQGNAGWVFLVGSTVLNAGLLAQSLRLLKVVDKPRARALFKYSMVYLALIFIVIAVDRVVVPGA